MKWKIVVVAMVALASCDARAAPRKYATARENQKQKPRLATFSSPTLKTNQAP